jgi:hypothetical protein
VFDADELLLGGPRDRRARVAMQEAQNRSHIAESAEAELFLSMAAAAPAEVQQALGMRQARIAGGVVTAMQHDPTGGFWNKALGFGFDQAFDAAALNEVLAFFDEAQAPAGVVQLSPVADPATWPDLLTARGLTPSATWVKFLSELKGPRDGATELDVRPIELETTQQYADVYARGFGMRTEGPFNEWVCALPSAPAWQCFGAWDGEQLISVANLFITGTVGVLGGAATLDNARGRGGQTALMAARINAAWHAGCEWISTETGTETAADPNPSLHNMRRIGLDELYERRNWIYRR